MIFATEGFESFNAIIRCASIHSNRHAPSKDIAERMAKGNRIRHLLAGGFFRVADSAGRSVKWHHVGPAPMGLLEIMSFGDDILGLNRPVDEGNHPLTGMCQINVNRWTLTDPCRYLRWRWTVKDLAKYSSLCVIPLSAITHSAFTDLPSCKIHYPSEW
jgi:hypothetical protein